MNLEDLKNKPNLTRADIAALLKHIGKPGHKQEAKIEAVKELSLKNTSALGGHDLHLTLESYTEF